MAMQSVTGFEKVPAKNDYCIGERLGDAEKNVSWNPFHLSKTLLLCELHNRLPLWGTADWLQQLKLGSVH